MSQADDVIAFFRSRPATTGYRFKDWKPEDGHSWRTTQNADDWAHEFRADLNEREAVHRAMCSMGLACILSFCVGVVATAVSYTFALG